MTRHALCAKVASQPGCKRKPEVGKDLPLSTRNCASEKRESPCMTISAVTCSSVGAVSVALYMSVKLACSSCTCGLTCREFNLFDVCGSRMI